MRKFERTTLQVGSFEVNCSIIAVDGNACIVDPGSEAERLIDCFRTNAWTPRAILLTHAHFDHIGAIPALCAAFSGIPIFLGAADSPVISHPMNQMPPDYPPVPPLANLTPLSVAQPDIGCRVEILETPGHTPGGVCYHFPDEKLLLSGDTLFAGSVGRTDLPGGDAATLMASVRRLKALPRETTVIPGHGPFTTIGRELDGNPFLQ